MRSEVDDELVDEVLVLILAWAAMAALGTVRGNSRGGSSRQARCRTVPQTPRPSS
jgi:hypothetical protein